MKKINFLIIILFFLISCGSIKDAGKVLRNEKIRNTDEFLVKKRDPLILPPDYSTLPEPQSIEKIKKKDKKIDKILKIPNIEKSQKSKTSSVEETILKQIRK